MDRFDKPQREGEQFPVARFLSNASNLILRSALRAYPVLTGLKVVEARTLHEIGLHGPVMARDIAKSACLHETQVSLAVKKLVGKKLIRFMRDSADRRRKLLTLTLAGRPKFKSIAEILEQRRRQILKGMSQKEQAQFFALLNKITENAEAMLIEDRDEEIQPKAVQGLAG
jgi:DNA-binding MarR family transcriptional regulator